MHFPAEQDDLLQTCLSAEKESSTLLIEELKKNAPKLKGIYMMILVKSGIQTSKVTKLNNELVKQIPKKSKMSLSNTSYTKCLDSSFLKLCLKCSHKLTYCLTHKKIKVKH